MNVPDVAASAASSIWTSPFPEGNSCEDFAGSFSCRRTDIWKGADLLPGTILSSACPEGLSERPLSWDVKGEVTQKFNHAMRFEHCNRASFGNVFA